VRGLSHLALEEIRSIECSIECFAVSLVGSVALLASPPALALCAVRICLASGRGLVGDVRCCARLVRLASFLDPILNVDDLLRKCRGTCVKEKDRARSQKILLFFPCGVQHGKVCPQARAGGPANEERSGRRH